MNSTLAIILFIIAIIVSCAPKLSKENMNVILFEQTIKDFNEKKVDFELIDVRTPKEYATGHLMDSKLIDFSRPDFRSKVKNLPRDKNYLLYCRSGNRSGSALRMMKKMGFENVAHLSGGINAWRSKQKPLTQ